MVAATVHRKPGRKAPPPEPVPAPPPLAVKPTTKKPTPPPAPVWDGAPFTVGELVEAAGNGRRQLVALSIVWLCKLGLLDWRA